MRPTQLALLIFGLLFSCSSKEKEKTAYLASERTTMAAPLLECENLFFTDSIEINMKFSLPDSNIKYTLDGSPVTDASKIYDKPLKLDNTTLVKAKNFHSEFQSSALATLKVVKTNTKLSGSEITVLPAPNERYQGNGASSLSDHIKGTASFANGNAWLGFQADSVLLDIDFSEAKSITKITVSTLVNHGAWIFLPKKITVYFGTQEVGFANLSAPSETDRSRLEFIEIPIEENTYDNLSIVVSPVSKIPEWHQGKGTVAWFFTDEILVE